MAVAAILRNRTRTHQSSGDETANVNVYTTTSYMQRAAPMPI